MSVNSPIRLVIFDLGRVLVGICDDWQHACRRAGVPFPEPGGFGGAALNDLARRLDIGQLDLPAFSQAASPIVGMAAEQICAASNAYLHPAFAGGAELIDELYAAGVATACLSNTNESHWRMMNDPAQPAHVPLHRLTHRFASHLCGLRKPDPAIYAHVEQETGAPPASILFFDDIEENVQAAQRRGWHAFQVTPATEDPIRLVRGELLRRGVLKT